MGRHARRPIIKNDFQSRGRRSCTGSVGRGMKATGGPPHIGLVSGVKKPCIICIWQTDHEEGPMLSSVRTVGDVRQVL